MRTLEQLNRIAIQKPGSFGSPYYEAQGDKFVNVILSENEEKVHKTLLVMKGTSLTYERVLKYMQEIAEAYADDVAEQFAIEAAGESI